MERRSTIITRVDDLLPSNIYRAAARATFGRGLIEKDARQVTALSEAAHTRSPEYFLFPEGKQLVEDMSQYAYQRLEEFGDLCKKRADGRNETAYTVYQKYMQTASSAVNMLIDSIAPEQRYLFAPKNRVDFIPEPGNLVQLLSTPPEQIDPVYRFELARHVMLALTAAEIDKLTVDLRNRVGEVQDLLDAKLFAQPLGNGKSITLAYSTDPTTNQVIAVERAAGNPKEDSGVAKSEPMSVREVADVGLVHIDPRYKHNGEALNKAIRDALYQKLAKGKDGAISKDVLQDTAGIRFIVLNEFSNEGQGVSNLIQKFEDVLQSHYRNGVTIEEKPHREGAGKKDKFKVRKVMVKFHDGTDIEVMFLGIGDHLNNEKRLGHYDGFTNTYDGQAHDLYKIDRGVPLFQLYFPKSIYGDYDEKEIVAKAHQRVAHQLVGDTTETAGKSTNNLAFSYLTT